MPVINWDRIKTDYIYGIVEFDNAYTQNIVIYPTHKDLATKYEVSFNTIRQKSAREGWKYQREKIQMQVSQEAGKERIRERYTIGANIDAQNLSALDKVNQLISLYFEPYEDYLDAASLPPEVKVRDLKDIMDVLQKRHKLARDILGEEDKTQTPDLVGRSEAGGMLGEGDDSEFLAMLVERQQRKKELEAQREALANKPSEEEDANDDA